MNTTKPKIFRGCLIASISHAIMTNVYPELSYEQSWDGTNYSMQNTAGSRGTITFDREFCIGAIRNDASNPTVDKEFIRSITKSFPLKIVEKAYEDTLQYLLVENGRENVPCVTSMFWADDAGFYCQKENADAVKKDLILFSKILLPEEAAIDAWKEYYDMDSNTVSLLKTLYRKKEKDFASKIVLSEVQKGFIPGNVIRSECIESLKELNIFLE